MKRDNSYLFDALNVIDVLSRLHNIEGDISTVVKTLKTKEVNRLTNYEYKIITEFLNSLDLDKPVVFETDTELINELGRVLDSVNWTQRDNLLLVKYAKSYFLTGWHNLLGVCRGKVVDLNTYSIVSYPFDKFFNLNEVAETKVDRVNDLLSNAEYVSITEKADGSTIIVSKVNDEFLINTNGSFDSDQALIAKNLIDAKYGVFKSNASDDMTYIFELIHPQDPHVLDYGDEEKLLLIGARELKSGELVLYNELKDIAKSLELEVVDSVETNINTLIEDMSRSDYINKEGYVIHIITPSENVMLKLKYAEFFKMHSLVSETTPKNILHCLRHDVFDDVLSALPEYKQDTARKVANEIREVLSKYTSDIEFHAFNLTSKYGVKRGEFAEIKKDRQHPLYQSMVSIFKEINSLNAIFKKPLNMWFLYGNSVEIQDVEYNDYKVIAKHYGVESEEVC